MFHVKHSLCAMRKPKYRETIRNMFHVNIWFRENETRNM